MNAAFILMYFQILRALVSKGSNLWDMQDLWGWQTTLTRFELRYSAWFIFWLEKYSGCQIQQLRKFSTWIKATESIKMLGCWLPFLDATPTPELLKVTNSLKSPFIQLYSLQKNPQNKAISTFFEAIIKIIENLILSKLFCPDASL